MNHSDLVRRIAFGRLRNVSGATARELLRRASGIENFFGLSQAELRTMLGSEAEITSDNYRRNLIEISEKEALFVEHNSIKALMIDTDGYPHRLAECDDAPSVIYQLGHCDLNSRHIVGIVGTRHATPYGVNFTEQLVKDLARMLPDLVVVSGLAYGIDIAAHKAAIAAEVPTVAVLAHGLNMIYPAEHRSAAAKIVKGGGALVSEYTTDTRIHRSNFLARNRIVAGLCDCLIVVESDTHGGALTTARIASQYNREVFAVPGRISDTYSRGTNNLIASNAAVLLRGADDLIEQCGWTAVSTADSAPTLFRALSAEEQLLLDFIIGHPDATVNDICVGLGLPYSTVSERIFQMEMDDIVMSLPGGRFAPTAR